METRQKTVERMIELVESDTIYTLTENAALYKLHLGLPTGDKKLSELRDILKDKRMGPVFKKLREIQIDLERHIKNLVGEELAQEINESDIISTLVALGYKKTQARRGLETAKQRLGREASQDEILKAAIQLAK